MESTIVTIPNWLVLLVIGLHIVCAVIGAIGVTLIAWVWGSVLKEKRSRDQLS